MMANVKRLTIMVLMFAMVLLQACSSSEDNSTGEEAAADTSTESQAISDEAPSAAADSGEETFNSAADRDTEPKPEKDGGSDVNGSAEPGAGILTAGEWDDNAEWERWNKLLQSHEGAEYQPYWNFFDFRRLEVKVTAGGRPVADAVVTMREGDGQDGWMARTNAAGVAYLFPMLFEEQGGNVKYGLTVEAGQQKKQFENVELKSSREMEVKLDQAHQQPNAVDLMLVVDTTGSMSDELEFLEAELKDVVNRVADDNNGQLDIRISPNFYRDVHDDYTVRPFPFTRDIDKAVGQIADQSAKGGGDFPEAVEEALEDAIEDHEWSEEALARLMFLVLDAPPHHEGKVVKQLKQLTTRAAEEGIRIIPIASSGVDIQTEHLMRYLATATGGTYIFLTDHSGVGNGHLKPAVGEYEVRALNDLMVDVISRYVRG